MSTVDFHKVALDYHKRGWNVLPVEGKRPIVSGWKKWQTTKMDASEINRMETYWRDATGIAVVCGAVSGNLVVIDLDGQQAIDLFYSQFPRLTRTYTVKTGNGLHLYFYQHHKFITDSKANHKIVIGDGEISVRVQNCYVVAPPSKHPSGAIYEVESGWQIKRSATLGRVLMWMKSQKTTPSALDSRVEEPQNASKAAPGGTNEKTTDVDRGNEWGKAALEAEVKILSSAGKGGRNDQLYKSAVKLGSIVAGGYLDEMFVISMLLMSCRENGLSADDGIEQCNKTIQSGLKVGMKSPRHPSNDSAPSKPSNGNKPDLDKTPDDKQAEDNHPLQMKPDAEQLATYIQSLMQSQYTYFRDSWQRYEDGVWKPIKNLNKGITMHIKSVRNRGVAANPATVNNVSFFLQTELELMDEDVIDNYPQHIACNNGLFNLDKMELEPHSPAHYLTGKTTWDYDLKATCPVFLKWLSSMMTYPDGSPDQELMDFVQEAFGYSLTTDTRYRMSFWLKGPKHSGKSTLLEVLSEMLNIYHAPLELNELDKNRFLLALTYQKRVVTCPEVRKGLKIDDGKYKQLVDNASTVVADVKNQAPLIFKPTAKVWWAMNNFPHISDNTGAVHSRVTVIPYHRTITIDERDLDLLDKIKCELSGVFNWAIEGLMRLNHSRRFTTVPQSDELKADLEVKDSIYRQFLEDDLWCIPGGDTKSRVLNDAFTLWCEKKRIRGYAKTNRGRYQSWEDAGLIGDKLGGERKFVGVHLTDYAKRQIL